MGCGGFRVALFSAIVPEIFWDLVILAELLAAGGRIEPSKSHELVLRSDAIAVESQFREAIGKGFEYHRREVLVGGEAGRVLRGGVRRELLEVPAVFAVAASGYPARLALLRLGQADVAFAARPTRLAHTPLVQFHIEAFALEALDFCSRAVNGHVVPYVGHRRSPWLV